MSEAVRSMFADISGHYDVMNSVISLGMHHSWRRRLVRLSEAKAGDRVLDCASGTGDLAFEFKRVVGDKGSVVATDFCEPMLAHIPEKSQQNSLHVDVAVADVMNLPYADNSFDIASIAYGIRNVDDPVQGLSEMCRVVRDGGRIAVLETGQPHGLIRVPFAVFQRLIPLAGRLVAGNRAAYHYLPTTAATFPYGNSFLKLVRAIPTVESAFAFPLFFGVSYLYIVRISKK